jgi:chromosome segregation ATPase
VSSVRLESALDEKGVLDLRLQESVLEVAEHLRDRNLGSARITQVLAAILEQEEKIMELRNQKHMLQTQLDSIEVSGRERAARLRHAIISLTLETKGKMETGDVPAKLAEDVRYQIVELERRLSEVITDQERSEKELEKQLARLVQELQSIEHEIRKNQDALFELIQAARGSIGNSSTLRNAFGQIDELRQKIARFSL